MLKCVNLKLSYKDGLTSNTVLSNVNLEILKGQDVIILGPSGSGKSSLIYLLSLLRKPSSGKIIFDNKVISELKDIELSSLRKKKFGFIFQMHFLIPYLSTLENVLVGAKAFDDKSKEKARLLLRELGIEKYASKKIYELSGGERQRVAIARAVISDPDIIFADEPTASLDHKNACDIFKMLKQYKENSTLIMATHDTSIVEGNERVLIIKNKGLVES